MGFVDRAGTEMDVDEEMNEEFTMEQERALQTTPPITIRSAV